MTDITTLATTEAAYIICGFGIAVCAAVIAYLSDM